MAAFTVGRNVSIDISKNVMTVTIDLSAEGITSGSGKSDTIATTGAPQAVGSLPDGRPVKMNLSVFAPLKA